MALYGFWCGKFEQWAVISMLGEGGGYWEETERGSAKIKAEHFLL
jgi:hypothetical protein